MTFLKKKLEKKTYRRVFTTFTSLNNESENLSILSGSGRKLNRTFF